jgi:putative acetyltransferase
MMTDTSRPIAIRDERDADAAAIRRVLEGAFKSHAEADIVDKLRAQGRFAMSLVATIGGSIVGHVLLTDVELVDAGDAIRGAGVAPLAVRPAFQRRGIGGALMRAALERARADGYDYVVLLGDPGYYERFEFRAAAQLGLACEFDAPPEAFLAIELNPGALKGTSGTVRYAPEFAEAVS